MKIRRRFALGGAVAAIGLIGAGPALAAGPAVSVRVEGVKRTLLPAAVVRGESGWITKGGTPKGLCPGSSAAGALSRATRGRWGATYSSGVGGIEVTSILGETHKFSAKGYYWGVWVNNRYAQAGVCGLKLHRGEQLLFAAAPSQGTVYPIVISAPRHARKGSSFRVDTYYYTTKGDQKPLAGVSVTGGGVTDGRGIAAVRASRSGKLRLTATRRGYVRTEATVAVSG